MSNKIFVTGATGFLGSNLIRKLHGQKNKLTILVNKTKSHPLLNGLSIAKKEGDIRNYSSVLRAMKGCDYVYHLASIFSDKKGYRKIMDTNVLGTENIMRASLKLGVKKIVHVSTTSIFGASKDEGLKFNENSRISIKGNIYGESKKKAEDIVQKYCQKGLNAVIVNPCGIIGAGKTNAEQYGRICRTKIGKIMLVFPGGESMIAVEDVVKGIILAMKYGNAGNRYIIANEFKKYSEQYDIIAKIMHKPRMKVVLPKFVYYPLYFFAYVSEILGVDIITPRQVMFGFSYNRYDTSKAQKELHWKPKISFKESMEDEIRYYKRHFNKNYNL